MTPTKKQMDEAMAFDRREIEVGRIEMQDIAVLVFEFQKRHSLEVDGKAGEETVSRLRQLALGDRRIFPMPLLTTGNKVRRPQITSGFRSADRSDHNGVDIFYRYDASIDPPVHVGDGGATRGEDGKPKWFVPEGTPALAVEDGVVSRSSRISTGGRIAINLTHGPEQVIYCHLKEMFVKVGDVVRAGQELGIIDNNPIDVDADHGHIEVSKSKSAYQPIDPKPWLRAARFIERGGR